MKFLIQSSSGKTTVCDEDAATERLQNDSSGHVARFGSNHWVRGTTFLEYGELAFDYPEFQVVLDEVNSSQSELIVTTETFPPYTVTSRLGVVAAERVTGINALKDFAASLTDTFGGSNATLEAELARARGDVLSELKKQAAAMRADGIIALSFSYSPIEGKGSLMLLVAGWGTAVTFSHESIS